MIDRIKTLFLYCGDSRFVILADYLVQTMVHAIRNSDFSTEQFRKALGGFPTGVTVITAQDSNGQLVGLTVSSFNSVSLDPPLVLWSLNLRSRSIQAFRAVTHYGINVLAHDQEAIARQFSGPIESRFVGIAFDEGIGGSALLRGSVAQFECFNRSRYEEGDHLIFVGEVERCTYFDKSPLIYANGKFAGLTQQPDSN